MSAQNTANNAEAPVTSSIVRGTADFTQRQATLTVTACTTYTFTVTATNQGGVTSAASTSINLSPECNLVPGAPTGITFVSRATTQLVVTWTAPGYTGSSAIIEYKCNYQEFGAASNTGSVSVTSAADPTNFNDRRITMTGLVDGKVYTITCQARNSAGYSALSTAVNLQAGTVPAKPLSVRTVYQSASNTVAITWSAPASNGGWTVDGYSVSI